MISSPGNDQLGAFKSEITFHGPAQNHSARLRQVIDAMGATGLKTNVAAMATKMALIGRPGQIVEKSERCIDQQLLVFFISYLL